MDKKLSLIFLILSFAMLWLPFGQHEFLYEHWMKLGTFMAPFLLYSAFSYRQPNTPITSDVRLLALLMMIIYIAHQFEEHWIDLTGNVYAFQAFLNATLVSVLGIANHNTMLISKADIFVINTSIVWLVACLAIYCAPKRIFPALALSGVMLINAISHSVPSIKNFSYNPGLMTSIVIFVPFSLWFYISMLKQMQADVRLIFLSLGWALIAHIILMVGLVLVNHISILPSIVYYSALIIWSFLPALIKPYSGTN